MSLKKPKYLSTFQKSYSVEFPCIISSRKGNTFATCTVCNCDFSISHGGRSDAQKHVKTDKHKSTCIAIENSGKLKFSIENNDQKVIKAECLFATFLLEHNLPLNAADHAGPLFRKMFPDSDIAKKFSCARTKTNAILKEMGLKKRSSIIDIIKTAPFCIATDGTNDSDSKLYPIVVYFFNPDSSEIECGLLSIPNLVGDSTGINIAELILRNLNELDVPFENCLAFGADNAPVMKGLKNGVAGCLIKENSNLQIMGCLCHLINLAAEKGAASLPISIDEFAVDIFYYLEKSSKRKEKFNDLQHLHNTEIRKILKHVCTRWLSLQKSLTRIVEQWNPLLSFFKNEANEIVQAKSPKVPKKKNKDVCISKRSTERNSSTSTNVKPVIKVNENIFCDIKSSDKSVSTPVPVFKFESIHKTKANNLTTDTERSSSKYVKPVIKVNQNKNLSSDMKNSTKSASTSASVINLESNNPKTKASKRKAEQSNSQNKKFARQKKQPSFDKCLSRQECLFMFLSADINKAFCLFIKSVLPMFNIPNTILQTQAPLIHALHSVIRDMFKEILSKFVKPSVVLSSDSIYEVRYNEAENQKTDEDLVIGSATSKLVQTLTEKDKKLFYSHVRKYFCCVCDYILKSFPFRDAVILHAKVANVATLSDASFSDVNFFINRYPVLINLIFGNASIDSAVDKLQSQFCALQLENVEEITRSTRIDTQWNLIGKIKSADGILKYSEISKIMLAILTIPHSNADCERIFSIVNKTRTKFRSNISNDTLEKLLLAKTGLRGNCYEQLYDANFLKVAKSATTAINNANITN